MTVILTRKVEKILSKLSTDIQNVLSIIFIWYENLDEIPRSRGKQLWWFHIISCTNSNKDQIWYRIKITGELNAENGENFQLLPFPLKTFKKIFAAI